MTVSVASQFDTHAGLRAALRDVAAQKGEWAGIPMPLQGERLVIEPTYPYAALSAIGARDVDEADDAGVKVRNTFWSTKLASRVVIYQEADGRIRWGIDPGVHHFTQDLQTLGCADAWGLEQEETAMRLLSTLVKPRALKQYLLTGMFLETSRRSGLIYMFRRLKPTVALTPRGTRRRSMRRTSTDSDVGILAALCLHPIGYYSGSWAGALCPTDDVIAHLMLMRGDEAMFWRRSYQHAPWTPEAGL